MSSTRKRTTGKGSGLRVGLGVAGLGIVLWVALSAAASTSPVSSASTEPDDIMPIPASTMSELMS